MNPMYRRLWAVAWLASLGATAPVAASTLTPGHPVWRTPGVDTASVLRFQREQRADRATRRKPTLDTLGKGFERYGQHALVLPVLYADDPTPPAVPLDAIRSRLFDASQPSSLRSYYGYVSSDRFAPTGVVLDWIVLPEPRSFYANVRDGIFRGNAGPRLLVRDAMRVAGDRVDLGAFDDDGPDGIPDSGDDDGLVDLLLVLHPDAGFETDPVPAGPSMLAHQGRIDLDPDRPDPNHAADAYAMLSVEGPLGVWAHETGHLLGLDDLYDLDVTGTLEDEPNRGGLGAWSLMAHGAWGGGGDEPSHLDAFSRRRLGWEDREIEVLVPGVWLLDRVGPGTNQSLRVQPFGDWEGEEFLLENRRRRPGEVIDADLPGSGVLVLRVDPKLSLNRQGEGYGVTLLEADGDDAIATLLDNGAAGDVFTGAAGRDRLDATTNPSTQSRVPAASRVPPSISIAAADGQGGHEITVTLTSGPDLRLLEAFFPAGSDRKTFLSPGEDRPWNVRFRSLGPSDPTTATLELLAIDPRLELIGDNPVALEVAGPWWEPATTWTLRSTQLAAESIAPVVQLGLTVDGGAQRQIEIGVPVGFGPGLRGEDFFFFEPAVLAAGLETTQFTLLDLADMPPPAAAGWVTTVDGEPGYGDDADLTLTGPWIALPSQAELVFWTRHETESGQPGQAWDGGILEVFAPGRGWQPLEPAGPGTVLIEGRSRSSTRGRVGFGGPASPWRAMRIDLPVYDAPVRLRARFGSDGDTHRGSWALAHLATAPDPATAQVSVRQDPLGQWEGEAVLSGDFTGILNLQFRARAPLEAAWTPVSDPLRVRADLPTLFADLDLPGDEVLHVGLFSVASAPGEPELLIGTVGLRRPSGRIELRARTSPALGTAELFITASTVRRHLDVFDVRGRRVRSLVVDPNLQVIAWDGNDESGRRVASGRYFALLRENPDTKTSLVLLH